VSLSTESPPLLIVVCALGGLAGIALGQVFDKYMAWFRSRYPPLGHNGLRRIAGLAVVVPLGLLGLAARESLDGGPDADGFFAGVVVGWLLVIAWDFRRWIRARRP
jgi:hypothetical protein